MNFCLSQSVNYPEVFGDAWKKALVYEKENRYWIEPVLTANNIPYPTAIAVVFPELVRYSALRDKMEITLLKALYVNLGEEYANFSIGQFQMKPSFAEMIRTIAPSVLGPNSGITFKMMSEFDDSSAYRKSIVTDLEDPRIQLNYLVAFLKICERKFKLNRKNEVPGIKFLATAYNSGFDKSSGKIESMVDRKYFNTKLFKTVSYSYADVSVFWYLQYKQDRY